MVQLAARQHGVVAAWQLRELGITQHMVRRRLEAGRLYHLDRGVYSLTPSITGKGRLMAAVLACGPEASLSHNAAAAIWDVGPWPAGAIHVTVPSKHARRRGLVIHRACVERIIRDGFPVTTVARTLVDVASVLSLQHLELAFERAERLRLLDTDEVATEAKRRRGARKVRTILSSLTTPEPTRSMFERLLRDICKRHNLPLPAQNVSVAGEDVDAYWQESNLVVELDSWEFHKTRRAFERDRRKAAALERAGIRVLRFTWNQLTRDEAAVAATSRRAL
jgi:very-short-patch-repair endonuclease